MAESRNKDGTSKPIRTRPCHPMARVLSQAIDWRKVSTATAYTWHAIGSALSQSGLSVEKLNIFGNTPQCSVAIDEFAAAVGPQSFSASFANLQHLTLHISHHKTSKNDKVEERYSLAKSKISTEALRQTLGLCSPLVSLNLHWHDFASPNLTEALRGERNFLAHLSSPNQLPTLRSLGLYGLRVREDVLLAFLKAMTLERVALEGIMLETGTFRQVFDHSSDARLQHLSLYHLGEPQSVHFVSEKRACYLGGTEQLMLCGQNNTSTRIFYVCKRAKATNRPPPPRKVCYCLSSVS